MSRPAAANVGSDDPVLGNLQPERDRLIGGQCPAGSDRLNELGWGHGPACMIERFFEAKNSIPRAASNLTAQATSRGRQDRARLWLPMLEDQGRERIEGDRQSNVATRGVKLAESLGDPSTARFGIALSCFDHAQCDQHQFLAVTLAGGLSKGDGFESGSAGGAEIVKSDACKGQSLEGPV